MDLREDLFIKMERAGEHKETFSLSLSLRQIMDNIISHLTTFTYCTLETISYLNHGVIIFSN